MTWKHFCSMLVDAVEPAAVGAPKYLLSSDEAIGISESLACGPEAVAYTSRTLDLELGEELVKRSMWKGRGLAAVVDVRRHQGLLQEIGYSVLHELCHYLDFGAPVGPVPDIIERSRTIASWSKPANDSTVKPTNDSPSKPLPKWHNHGLNFVRAAAHVTRRAQKILPGMGDDSLRFAAPYYSVSERDFIAALGSEVSTRSKESIAKIIRSPAPKAFVDLWSKATGTKPTVSICKPLIARYWDSRRTQRQAILQRDGVLAVLADQSKPEMVDGTPEVLLMDGFETRAGLHSLPLVDLDNGSGETVRSIVGSIRSLKVQDGKLLGSVAFASDEQAQVVKRQFEAGERTAFKMQVDSREGYLLEPGEIYRGIDGPATVVTRWSPLRVTTSKSN